MSVQFVSFSLFRLDRGTLAILVWPKQLLLNLWLEPMTPCSMGKCSTQLSCNPHLRHKSLQDGSALELALDPHPTQKTHTHKSQTIIHRMSVLPYIRINCIHEPLVTIAFQRAVWMLEHVGTNSLLMPVCRPTVHSCRSGYTVPCCPSLSAATFSQWPGVRNVWYLGP